MPKAENPDTQGPDKIDNVANLNVAGGQEQAKNYAKKAVTGIARRLEKSEKLKGQRLGKKTTYRRYCERSGKIDRKKDEEGVLGRLVP